MGTATAVNSLQTEKQQRSTAEVRAYRSMCELMLYSQLVLYGTLVVLPKAGSASWWMAGALVLPALAIGGIVRWARRGGLEMGETLLKGLGSKGRAAAGILYGLLLGADIQWALSGLTELTASFVIEDGGVWQLAPWGAVAGIAAVCLGREMGVARSCYLLRWLLAAVLVGCVIAALPMGDVVHLFPWQFEGLETDIKQLWGWSAGLWPMVLIGAAPGGARSGHAREFRSVLCAIAGVLLLFFGYCFVLPPRTFLLPMTWGERMVVFLRATPSKLIWELLIIFKMTVMLLNICAAASLAGRLLTRWTFPKVYPGLWAAGLILAALPLAANHTWRGQEILSAIGPWRLPLALTPVAAAGLLRRIKERRSA